MLSIGFTGTRHGMTPDQDCMIQAMIAAMVTSDRFQAHHGNCVGADERFHKLVRITAPHGYIVLHPAPGFALQAGCFGDFRYDPAPHMQRNRAIVAASTVMIATPAEATEQQRGGTWSTIRMARRAGKPLAIVLPSGEVVKERWL